MVDFLLYSENFKELSGVIRELTGVIGRYSAWQKLNYRRHPRAILLFLLAMLPVAVAIAVSVTVAIAVTVMA